MNCIVIVAWSVGGSCFRTWPAICFTDSRADAVFFFGRILWRVEKSGHSQKLMAFWIFMDPLLRWRILELNPNHQLTIPPWNPNNLYFWRSTPQNKALPDQKKGHLGSRTTKFTKRISPQHPESSNMGNPGWSLETMRFCWVRGVEAHYFCWVPLQEAFPFFGAAFWQQQRKLNPGKKIGHLFVTLIADIWKSFQNHFAVEIPFISSGFAGLQHAKSAHVE